MTEVVCTFKKANYGENICCNKFCIYCFAIDVYYFGLLAFLYIATCISLMVKLEFKFEGSGIQLEVGTYSIVTKNSPSPQ